MEENGRNYFNFINYNNYYFVDFSGNFDWVNWRQQWDSTAEHLGALEANDKAIATEKMELKITYLNMVSYGENTRKVTLQELADGLFVDKEVDYVRLKNQEVASLEPIDVTGESSFFVKLKEYVYEFEIDENLQLASVDGEKVATSNTQINEIKKELEKSNETINQLKQDVQELANKVNNSQTMNGDELYNYDMASSNNKADKIGEYSFAFPEGKTLDNYKYVYFCTDSYEYNLGWIDKNWVYAEAKANDNLYDLFSTFFYGNGGHIYSVLFSIKDKSHFRIDEMEFYNGRAKVRICKIIGIY